MELNIRLLADRVLVEEQTAKEETTASGLILPTLEGSNEHSVQGVVKGVSQRVTDCEKEEDKVYEGDRIIYSKYAGTAVSYKGITYKVLRITDVIAVVKV